MQIAARIPQRLFVSMGSPVGPPRQIPATIVMETNAMTATKAKVEPSGGMTMSGISGIIGSRFDRKRSVYKQPGKVDETCSQLAKQFQPRSLLLQWGERLTLPGMPKAHYSPPIARAGVPSGGNQAREIGLGKNVVRRMHELCGQTTRKPLVATALPQTRLSLSKAFGFFQGFQR